MNERFEVFTIYHFELHTHLKGTSFCASVDAQTTVRRYLAAGYEGLVSTNHINNATFGTLESAPWAEKVDFFLRGCERLEQAAGDKLDVLLGCEINLSGKSGISLPNDYLVYGIDKQWLLSLGDPRGMSLRALSEYVRGTDKLLIQAHPFRYGTMIMEDQLLDGFEVYNGNMNHDSHDILARTWATYLGKIQTSGSDFHDPGSRINAGIATETRIRNNQDLLAVLRSGRYQLIQPA